MGEFGMVTAKGTAHARELMALVASEERIPALAREALHQLVEQIRETERRIEELDRQILAMAKAHPVARRLMTIPSIGPYSATAIVAMVSDAQQFASAGISLPGWGSPPDSTPPAARNGSAGSASAVTVMSGAS
jgi:transposase